MPNSISLKIAVKTLCVNFQNYQNTVFNNLIITNLHIGKWNYNCLDYSITENLLVREWIKLYYENMHKNSFKISNLNVTENLNLKPLKLHKAKSIVDELYQWLLKHKDKIPPKMALGKAINYAIN